MCVIGESCELGDKVTVKQSCIGKGCQIGAKSKLNNCVVMDYTIIGERCVHIFISSYSSSCQLFSPLFSSPLFFFIICVSALVLTCIFAITIIMTHLSHSTYSDTVQSSHLSSLLLVLLYVCVRVLMQLYYPEQRNKR